MTLDMHAIPTPNEAKKIRSERIDKVLNEALQNLASKIKDHDFDDSSLTVPYGDIIKPNPKLSQFDGVALIEKILHRKGWHTKHTNERNEDYLIISEHSLIERQLVQGKGGL